MIKKIKEVVISKFREKTYFLVGAALLFLALAGGIYISLPNVFAIEQRVEEKTNQIKKKPRVFLDYPMQFEPEEKIDYVPVDLVQWKASASFLNLSTKFPEGADTSDPTQSYAGKILKQLLDADGEWYSQIIAFLDDKPEQIASKLGKPISAVYGKYNVTDKEQDPFRKETWTVKKWDAVNVRVVDANGVSLEHNSNLKEIMAMANVYGYFHNWEDDELFLNYAMQLLNSSRKYEISMSEISFDKEILKDDDIQKAVAEGRGQDLVDYFKSHPMLQSTNNPISVPESAEFVLDNANALDSGSEVKNPSANIETSEQMEYRADTALKPTSHSRTGVEGGPGVVVATSSNAEESSATSIFDAHGVDVNTPQVSVIVPSEENLEDFLAHEYETDAEGNVLFPKKTGKLDLELKMTVYKLSGRKSLYSIDRTGNQKENFNENWQGWTEDKTALVDELVNKNWYAEFGISSSSFSTARTLTKDEIEQYLLELPSDLSAERRNVIEHALRTVGYIPYYFGGKPTSNELDNNHFNKIIAPDYKGRVFRGLDCSGWVNYILWSATGKRPAAASTAAFIYAGRAIDRSSLKAGDILVRGGTEETVGHIVIFLHWNPDGSMKVIEETGFPQNNVTISDRNIVWTCRNLLD